MTTRDHGHEDRLRRPPTPTTTAGRWAVELAIGYVVLMPLWPVLPGGALWAFASGLAGGVAAIAAVRRRERAVTVLAAILPLAFAAVVAGELLIPH